MEYLMADGHGDSLEYNCFSHSVGLQGTIRTQLNPYSVLFPLSLSPSLYNIPSATGLWESVFLKASWIPRVTAICNILTETTVKQYFPYSLTTPLTQKCAYLRHFIEKKLISEMGCLLASLHLPLLSFLPHTNTQKLAGGNQTNLATRSALWCWFS